ncbi:alpha/beta hydrolase [Listeria newyorkensis]|uniref:Alpha/beta hydrolase n=1 Tax=Listeria newyorkensis TaxID=1497681 RepID=A0A841YW65_9LIST|nr:alpha/beta hydrolase [Listeria newyorkensis]MBC1457202.1 alpha/beta hydrolase [Listeria newyorkensis]
MKKKRGMMIGAIVLVVVLLFMSFRTTLFDPLGFRVKQALNISSSTSSDDEPIVFIHGFDGSNWTFFTTTVRYSATNFATRSLTLLVRENGDIEASGVYDKGMKRPMIRVNFENPRSIIPNNATWFSKAMDTLKSDYGIEKVDIVAHSYGGLTFVNFLQKYNYQSDSYPKVDKFTAIGTPFNGSSVSSDGETPYDLTATGPKKESAYFQEMMKRKAKIPANLQVLNIVGDLDDGSRSDGPVAVDSAKSAAFLFSKNDYREVLFTGRFAQHSWLHANIGVDREIKAFLENNN